MKCVKWRSDCDAGNQQSCKFIDEHLFWIACAFSFHFIDNVNYVTNTVHQAVRVTKAMVRLPQVIIVRYHVAMAKVQDINRHSIAPAADQNDPDPSHMSQEETNGANILLHSDDKVVKVPDTDVAKSVVENVHRLGNIDDAANQLSDDEIMIDQENWSTTKYKKKKKQQKNPTNSSLSNCFHKILLDSNQCFPIAHELNLNKTNNV